MTETNYRYERKFVVGNLPEQIVMNTLRLHPSNFQEIYSRRTVNNIYFDTLNFNHYYDHVNGRVHRSKIRIRWYADEISNIKNPVLEIKIKDGDAGHKKLFPLKVEAEITPKDLVDNLEEILNSSQVPAIVRDRMLSYNPTLINTYSRNYFTSFDQKYRITVDQGLKYYNVRYMDWSLQGAYHDGEGTIIELKYDVSEKNYHQITQHLPYRLYKKSKYVSGIILFNGC